MSLHFATDRAAGPMFRTELHGDVLLAVLDMPGRTMNVFSWGLMDQLEALLARIGSDPAIKASVLTSGKSTFLAGADLDMVRGFTEGAATSSRVELHRICGRLGRLFNSLEAQPKPIVAAINGLAFGGGLEVAMACHHRVCSDDPRVELGLPEIKLGLMAAAGGTQRAPRLIGIEKGLEMLLGGRSLRSGEALAAGLVDELAKPEALVPRALEVAAAMAGKPAPKRLKQQLDPGPFDLSAPDVVARIARHFRYDEEITSRYPAYFAAIRSTIEGANLPIDEGGDNEMERFVDLMKDPVAGNMVTTLFIDRQQADKLTQGLPGPRNRRFAILPGEATVELSRALEAARAMMIPAAQANADDIVIGPAGSDAHADLIALSRDEGLTPSRRVGVAMAKSSHGRTLEIVDNDADSAVRDKALALARQLRASPYLHSGARSLLVELAGCRSPDLPPSQQIARMIERAAQLRDKNQVGDEPTADLAAVVGGLFPAYAGGPFRTLRRNAS